MEEEKEMAMEDLRLEMYTKLRQSGVFDNLKAQLRSHLLRQLRARGKLLPFTPQSQVSLVHKVANSLIFEYLQNVDYNYTLSIFGPEAGVTLSTRIHAEDTLRALRIHPSTLMHRTLSKFESGKHGSLLVMILEEIGNIFERNQTSQYVQTDHSTATVGLGDILKRVDDSHKAEIGGDSPVTSRSIEERMIRFQQECEKRIKEESQNQMKRFKENELNRIRLEESNKYRQQLSRMQAEFEREYISRIEKLQKREDDLVGDISRKEKQLDAAIYEQRQRMLENMQSIKNKEAELKREYDLNNRSLHLERERLHQKEELLNSRILEAEKLMENVKKRAEEDFLNYKRAVEKEFEEDMVTIQRDRRRLDDAQEAFDRELSFIQQMKDRLMNVESEFSTTQKALELTTKQLQETQQQLADLRRTYVILEERDHNGQRLLIEKDDRLEKARDEVSQLRRLLAEYQQRSEMQSKMIDDLNLKIESSGSSWKHTEETLRQEVENLRIENARLRDQAGNQLIKQQQIFKQQLSQLKAQSQEETQRAEALQKKLEEEVLQKRDLERDVENMRHMAQNQATTRGLEQRFSVPMLQDMVAAPASIMGHQIGSLTRPLSIDRQFYLSKNTSGNGRYYREDDVDAYDQGASGKQQITFKLSSSPEHDRYYQQEGSIPRLRSSPERHRAGLSRSSGRNDTDEYETEPAEETRASDVYFRPLRHQGELKQDPDRGRNPPTRSTFESERGAGRASIVQEPDEDVAYFAQSRDAAQSVRVAPRENYYAKEEIAYGKTVTFDGARKDDMGDAPFTSQHVAMEKEKRDQQSAAEEHARALALQKEQEAERLMKELQERERRALLERQEKDRLEKLDQQRKEQEEKDKRERERERLQRQREEAEQRQREYEERRIEEERRRQLAALREKQEAERKKRQLEEEQKRKAEEETQIKQLADSFNMARSEPSEPVNLDKGKSSGPSSTLKTNTVSNFVTYQTSFLMN
eukprot:TRINITY_DN789_c0_g3_i1.p1 TRINITY_DN789_c0_g3~~TRINITY_DN789_c0_g3_i1.p1  ORF type:complete len:983 (-),score=223.66 TRINITY_DN789_c0_g3_i1:61-3009(-)